MRYLEQNPLVEDLFPHSNQFYWGSCFCTAQDFLVQASPLITARRLEKFKNVIAHKTYTVTPVLERVDDLGNKSAVLRSAEAMGLQSIHIINGQRIKRCNRVSMGSEKWMDLFRHDNTKECLAHLKNQGRQILITDVGPLAKPLWEFDFTRPTAIVFGNEKTGVSDTAKKMADGYCKIPTVGFAQSLNISVAAAISFNAIYLQRIERLGCHGDLAQGQQEILLAHYLMKCLRNPRSYPHF